MGRKERRYAKKSAEKFHTRKPVKADKRILVVLAVVTVVVVMVTIYAKMAA
jgi:hypothetical protein